MLFRSNEILSNLFLAACRHGHVEFATALLREKESMSSRKGSEMIQLFADHKGRYIAEAIRFGRPETTRLIKTLEKFQKKDLTPPTMWEKISGFWFQTKLIIGSGLIRLWNYLRSWFMS